MPPQIILILYYSAGGHVAQMARMVARGVEEIEHAQARIRTVPRVSPTIEQTAAAIPESGPPYAQASDLEDCAALILGSPTRFGQVAAPLRYFLDGTSDAWLSGVLTGKPAAAFTASASPHGGQESTLLGMLLPLLHHGMLLMGLPYSEPELHNTAGGGGPYGAGHVSHTTGPVELHADEAALCKALGRRVAAVACRLERGLHQH